MAVQASSIRQTFAHKTVFLTGATGFVGKALVEKLLRSAPEIEQIYVLIRPREGQAVNDRLVTDIRDSPLFDRLRGEHDDFETFFSTKVIAVAGDVTSPMLGLTSSDLARLQQSVQIAIHSAASVKFNDTLDVAVRMNCSGALHVLDFVHTCPLVQCHLHLSTAYVNSNRINSDGDGDRPLVREQLYPLMFDVDDAFTQITTSTSPTEIQDLHDQLIGAYPNTYALTKSMAEHLLVSRARPTLPLVIVRPTIIGATWQEPMPGWVDQIAGAGALFFAVGLGVLSVQAGDETNTIDLVPLDLVVNTTLVSIAYKLHTTTSNSSWKRMKVRPFIVHSGTSDPRENPTDYVAPTRAMLAYFQAHPPTRAIFKPKLKIIRSHTRFRLAWFFKYKLRLSTLTTVASLSRSRRLQKKAQGLEKLTTRARMVNDILQPFAERQWIFQTDVMEKLRAFVGSNERDAWWLNASDIAWEQWTRCYCMGLKKYVMKEDGIEIMMDATTSGRPMVATSA